MHYNCLFMFAKITIEATILLGDSDSSQSAFRTVTTYCVATNEVIYLVEQTCTNK